MLKCVDEERKRRLIAQAEPKKRRKSSTFQELLGGDGASEADLLWAESLLK